MGRNVSGALKCVVKVKVENVKNATGVTKIICRFLLFAFYFFFRILILDLDQMHCIIFNKSQLIIIKIFESVEQELSMR